LGFEVQGVSDGKAALNAARGQRFDALLLDHHLPGLDGDAVLRALRADAGAASRAITAIATTADPDPAIHARLRDTGFARVLVKPLDAASLRKGLDALGIAFLPASSAPVPALDDGDGLQASGSLQALSALRGLLARELDGLADEWNDLRGDAATMAGRLHRLRAACGFCGARALQSAAEKLSDALRGAAPERVEETNTEFKRALAATRAALRRL
jgi:CheY-like chemotaxis protein